MITIYHKQHILEDDSNTSKQEKENVRANFLVIFSFHGVSQPKMRKKKQKIDQKTGKEKRKLTYEANVILFFFFLFCRIMNSFIKGAIEKVRLLGGEERVC